ncbi:cytochrome c oxidase assembly protein [Ehrlichia ruminantium]|uniref:Cytochrome c oxidase assembly protein CtaG n=7 Tax=Ehrlichia ruminantium TaxID=779 RepID=COXZ_EHRRW|nr:cytochrome c oxidase assembly protein [Ehrlichia ruminantium]Q5HA73.1 RecName: Full=Cytochrome c oxidase assembly protein CtaG [Ehrlichia ruminantium str. Welgevonden]QLK50897.1 cytochrome c oxidase assembly protein [Ehrlichia ruminantium]QLK51819.1 cytochrome c oxidase assembly protein [Ehrlichia ruminantium]QLK53658.1 cytochrome c oxidase assembly protein [Ehrlichia ruminantium]QLK55495.1 cytochrome c oxidase assembly protein [Ehrlichia ruminantium]QLK56411.1 cytochrome c oxidase assembl
MTQKAKNTIYLLILIILSMLCLVYASVPLYSIFCKVTGYGGTVRTATATQSKLGKTTIKIRFNADINKELPWKFYPEIPYTTVKPGEQKLIFYRAENLTNEYVSGMAVYNVTPYKVGKYFNKVACFCFTKQTLSPYQKTIMPVSFFIDPNIETDPETSDVKLITLSYTFFKYKENTK